MVFDGGMSYRLLAECDSLIHLDSMTDMEIIEYPFEVKDQNAELSTVLQGTAPALVEVAYPLSTPKLEKTEQQTSVSTRGSSVFKNDDDKNMPMVSVIIISVLATCFLIVVFLCFYKKKKEQRQDK
jgi:hypothetical protein